jgi:hypothetical protein
VATTSAKELGRLETMATASPEKLVVLSSEFFEEFGKF